MITVMFMAYELIPREYIFSNDSQAQKLAYNELTIYQHNKYAEYGYEDNTEFTAYLKDVYYAKVGDDYENDPDYLAAKNAINDSVNYRSNTDVQNFISFYNEKGYEIEYLEPVYARKKIVSRGRLLAIHSYNLFERFGKWISNLIRVETVWDVTDPNLKERYVRWEWDKRSNMPALVGSGTYHKYLIYFDEHFPFVHQNIIQIHFGKSTSQKKGVDVYDILNTATGEIDIREQEYPVDLGTGVTNQAAEDFHTVTYAENPSSFDALVYGEGEHYINAEQRTKGLTRIGNSFVIGILSLVLVYLLGLPLGVIMARRKDKIIDKIGNAYIVFIAAVPSLAYIFIFSAIGASIGLPTKWGDSRGFWLTIILPVVSLAMPSIGGLMKWMRRYMIDQSNADYVKFARSTGMTEREIFSKHIARNAFIFLVHGLPADILFAMVGALITERVYAVPGVGGLLTNGITAYDNGVIVGGTLFYSVLSILALILGDLLLAKYDPRVSFTNERG